MYGIVIMTNSSTKLQYLYDRLIGFFSIIMLHEEDGDGAYWYSNYSAEQPLGEC